MESCIKAGEPSHFSGNRTKIPKSETHSFKVNITHKPNKITTIFLRVVNILTNIVERVHVKNFAFKKSEGVLS